MCTQADMTNLKNRIQKLDIVDICIRERANAKWDFYKLTNKTVFASLLKGIPMRCKDTVLPVPLLRNCNLNCLTFAKYTRQAYNDNLCLSRALALRLQGNKKLDEETSKFFNLSSSITVRKETFQSFKVFIWTTIQKLNTRCNSISSRTTLIL